MKNTLILALSAALLGGCGSLGTQFVKMDEPQDGSRARLRIAANMLVRGIPESDCLNWSAAGSGTVFGGIVGSSGYRGRSLGMPDPNGRSGRHSGEMYLRAGKPVTFALDNTPESRMRCSIAVTFVPQENRDYELSMRTAEQDIRTDVCTAQLLDISNGGSEVVAIEKAGKCGR